MGKGIVSISLTVCTILLIPLDATAKGIRSLTSIHHKITVKTADKYVPGHSKPKVLYFYARWAKPCNQLQPQLKKTINSWHNKVAFKTIDVDDERNASLVEKYGISPIPTILYLDEQENIVKMDIGYSNKRSITKGIKKILHQNRDHG